MKIGAAHIKLLAAAAVIAFGLRTFSDNKADVDATNDEILCGDGVFPFYDTGERDALNNMITEHWYYGDPDTMRLMRDTDAVLKNFITIPGSQSDIAGMNVINRSIIILQIIKGRACRNILMMGIPQIFVHAFRHMPTGGVTSPTASPQIRIAPNWSGLIPNPFIT